MSRELPQDRDDLEREQLLVQSGKRYDERKTLVKLLRADRRNEDAWVAYVATFSSFEGKLKALTTSIKSLPHSFRLATALRDLSQSVASDPKLNQDGTEDVTANAAEFLKAEKTQNAKFKSIQSSASEIPRCDGQHDPNVDPPFRIVKLRGTWGSTFRVEDEMDSWLTRHVFYDRWHAEVAIEVFKMGGTDDEAFYLQLIRNYSTKKRALDAAKHPLDVAKADQARVRKEKEASKVQGVADKVQRSKAQLEKRRIAKEKAERLPSLQAAIRKEPKNAELRFNLAIELLRRVNCFQNIADCDSDFWLRIEAVQTNQTQSEYKKALNELNVSLALGFNDSLMSAKARFLVIVLSLRPNDVQLAAQKLIRFRGYEQPRPGHAEAVSRLLPLRALADNIVLDTARHLRRDPHDVEAISIQKAAYEFVGDKKGIGQAEQELRQARSMHTAGIRTKTSERERGSSTGTRRKNDGLELEATSKQVLEKLGMEARTTQVTGDGGIDIEAYDTRPIFAGKYIIQCKDWEQPVGVTEVRELYGVMMHAGAIKGILISTGTFTKQAYEFAKGKPLELIDGERLRGLISSLDTK